MPFEVDLRKYFTPQAIATTLRRLPPLKTPVLSRVYTDTRNHPMPVLGIDELDKVVSNVPVVRRGTAAFPLRGGERGVSYIEPHGVDVSAFLGGVELNNLKLLDNAGVQQWVDDKIDDMRRVVRKTSEALAGQSLSGKISYPMKTDSGLATYEVDFGSTLGYTPATLWDHHDADLAMVLNQLIELTTVVQESGYGSDIAIMAGAKAFVTLARMVISLSNSGHIAGQVTDKSISLAGYNVELMNAVYTDLTTSTTKKVVDDHKLVAVALDAPFRHYYCALDDVDAGLLPMPFYASPEKKQNPSGYEIVGKSKPMPVPVTKAICWATVTAE